MTKIVVTTGSERNGGQEPAPAVSMTIDGREMHGKGGLMLNPTTFRLIIFDPTLPLAADPSTYLYDSQVVDPANAGSAPWSTTYHSIYDYAQNLLTAYGDPTDLLFLFATAGFDVGMVPPPSFVELLMQCGAGTGLQTWLATPPGETGTQMWVNYPANYIILGASGLGKAFGEKFETVDRSGHPPDSLTTTLEIDI